MTETARGELAPPGPPRVFRPGRASGALPDIGLSLALASIGARRQREHGDEDPAGRFITDLATALRRGPDGEVRGQADAGRLDAAAVLMVGELLEEGILPARADSLDTGRSLAVLAGQWQLFTMGRRE